MKSLSFLFIPCAILFTACNSFQTTAKLVNRTPQALGVRLTKWGQLHEFTPVAPLTPSRFVPGVKNLEGTAVVDLLIDARGEVLDAAVVESSGDRQVAAAAINAFAGARFSPIHGYASSEPYVARHRIVFRASTSLAIKELIAWPAVQ